MVDDYHGTMAIPYRALEALDAPATRGFRRRAECRLAALARGRCRSVLDQGSARVAVSFERFGLPQGRRRAIFPLRNDGRQNQSVLYWSEALDAAPRVLIDPNTQRTDATVAISRFVPSPDGRILAYALSDGGTDWEIWRFRRVDDGVDLPDELRFTKFWELSWSRRPRRLVQPLPAACGRRQQCRRRAGRRPQAAGGALHRLGEPQSADAVAYRVRIIRRARRRRASPTMVAGGGEPVRRLKANGVDVVDLRRAGGRRHGVCSATGMRSTR